MLGHISATTYLRTYPINNKIKVSSLLSFLSPLLYPRLFTVFHPFFIRSASYTTLSDEHSNTHLKIPSVNPCNVGKLVFSNYLSLLNPKVDDFCVGSASVDELLLRISLVSPETARKYLRICSWRPEDVEALLLDFELAFRNSGFDARIVAYLWEIFRRVGDYDERFLYLPRSVEIMASILTNVGKFTEVESLLSAAERRRIFVANKETFSALIEGYVNAGELERALLIYDKIKRQNLVLPILCYRSIVNVLLKERNTAYAICVYEDMVKAGFEFGEIENRNLETLIGLLCWDGKINAGRELLTKIVANGWKPSRVILSEIASVYCEKKDFKDLLSFFAEMKCAPDSLVGNKVIHQLCSIFGIDIADSFFWELEQLGFSPNEITFGIFICFCCRDGKLRDAFCYLSEIYSRGFIPDRHSYNAVISSLFKVGMKEHARNVLNDMIDNGIKPDIATYRALLAGYCKARQFDDVKLLIKEMASCGLIILSPSEDPLCKAFCVLGLDPLTVRVKRDNDLRNFRTEFIDELGNGLYLDANLEEFEKTVTEILDDSLVPDFSLLLMRHCGTKNLREISVKLDEMAQWGQELTVSSLTELVISSYDSNCHIKTIAGLLGSNMSRFYKVDHEALNMLIQALSQKGFLDKCKQLLDGMHIRQLPITNVMYNSVLISMCKLGRVTDIRDCWDLSSKCSWFPEWRDFIFVLDVLSRKRMLKELLELFDIMINSNPDSLVQICDAFLQKLCSTGFTSVGHILISELRQNYKLDGPFYSHIVKGYSEERRFSEALTIYDTFLADNNPTLSPDAILILVPQLCKANRFEQALALKARGLMEYPSISCSIFSALVDGCCKTGRVVEANDVILEIFLKNVLPSADICNTLLQGHCKLSVSKTSNEILCSMIRRRISLSLSSYTNLLSLFLRNRLFQSICGLKTLMLLDHKFCHSVIYNMFIFYLFRTGNHTQVNAVLEELDGKGLKLDEVGYNFLIHGFSVHDDIQRSLVYLNDMFINGLRPNNRSLRAVIRYLCSNGKVQNAFEIYNEVKSRGWNVCSTLHYALLKGLLDNGRILEAERFVAQLLDKGIFSDTIYNNLVRIFGYNGKLETSVNLLDQILKDGSIPDASSYDCIVQRFCDHDNMGHAMDFLTEMIYRNLRPSLYTWDLVIDELCNKGHTVTADGILISMAKVDEIPTKKMYSSVINRYRLENNLSKASELLHRMQQHGYEPDFSTQWSLISSLRNSGERQGGYGSQGFLSRLLDGSGFSAVGRANSKLV